MPSTCSRPNFVFIITDQQRRDSLGCYGNRVIQTPNLEALASEGVVFDRAWVPMATTFPSHTSMLTGMYPRYHGVRWNGHTLDKDKATLAEALASNGYATASAERQNWPPGGCSYREHNQVAARLRRKTPCSLRYC